MWDKVLGASKGFMKAFKVCCIVCLDKVLGASKGFMKAFKVCCIVCGIKC